MTDKDNEVRIVLSPIAQVSGTFDETQAERLIKLARAMRNEESMKFSDVASVIEHMEESFHLLQLEENRLTDLYNHFTEEVSRLRSENAKLVSDNRRHTRVIDELMEYLELVRTVRYGDNEDD